MKARRKTLRNRAQVWVVTGMGLLLLGSVGVLVADTPVPAAEPEAPAALPGNPLATAELVSQRSGPGEAKGKEDELPKFDEVAKEHKEVLGPQGENGLFPLFYREKDDQLLAVVPNKMLKKNFLLASSIAAGPDLAGYMWGSNVVQWHEIDKKLVLIEPDLSNKTDEKSTVADVVGRTYTDRIVTAVPIVCKRGQDPVIDLGDLFKKGDLAGIGRVYGGGLDASLSRWAKRKAFPRNVEVAVDAAIMRPGNQGGTRAQVHYSIVELPKSDYKPREADPRVGYFITAIKDWSVPHDADTIFKRYIHRWDVRKAEPSKEVSDADPDHHITYYIEKTVPVKYRRYVREGILEWNRAFEKAGIRNAVQIEQQTDTVHADKDPEDVRYAFFRWIVSGRGFAMGPSLANPLTGEILDADIIFDDSMVRSWERQYATYSGTGLGLEEDAQLNAFLDQHPEWKFTGQTEYLLPDTTRLSGSANRPEPDVLEHLMHQPGYCTYATGLAHEMALAMSALEATGRKDLSEEFVGQMVREVTTHEVGHTLGLRHNFKASSWKSVEEILSTTDPNVPTCASIMDYNPGIIHPDPEKQGLFVTQAVGPYDEWAITYGYGIPDGQKHKDEAALLKAVLERVAEPGHIYGTDEDTGFFAPDPLVNRFDNGSDLLEYANHRMDMVRRLQKNVADWAVEDGDSYAKLRRAFDMLLAEYGRTVGFAVRYVGGQYLSRAHKGDPNAPAPIEIVPVAKQRAALELVTKTVFSDKDFIFDPALLNKLAAGRWSHWDSDAYDSTLDYPAHERIARVQYQALLYLLNPVLLNRVYDAELKVPTDADALTVPELLCTVTDAVWAELNETPSRSFTNRKPFVSSIRRNLQRQQLSMLLNLVLSQPGRSANADVHAVVCLKLGQLAERLGKLLEQGTAGKLDDFTRAHFDEAKSRIDRALAAEYRL
ncbi:MAG TPA: zinc-dependent metalloprotease [Phycisphaerae bacterium]|nr:zinc-dependent metalloprotease [Phycisphaerae bacterium]HNU44987.1 zinc-dependent metalloprotease [Phycisphaerae bacterium]